MTSNRTRKRAEQRENLLSSFKNVESKGDYLMEKRKHSEFFVVNPVLYLIIFTAYLINIFGGLAFELVKAKTQQAWQSLVDRKKEQGIGRLMVLSNQKKNSKPKSK